MAIERMFCSRLGAFEIACVPIAAAAVSIASFVYWAVLDRNGALFILIGTCVYRKPHPHRLAAGIT